MWVKLITIVALLAMQANSGFAADLRVLQRELDRLDAKPADAQARATPSVDERRARLQEQADAIRKAVESAKRVVIVNVPAYTLTAYENGQPVLQSKVIVGAVERKTPLIETQVAGVQLNPAWNAPPKVVKGDLTRNGSIDERAVRHKGLSVFDEKGNPLPTEALSLVPPEQTQRLRFYQPPGERNALGQVKVTLKGVSDIYLHDTPNKSLFRKTKRALSSGCVRVEKARELAAWLTGKNPADIDRLIKTKTTRTLVVQPTQVIVGYWLSDTVGERAVYVDDIYRLASQRSAPATAPATTHATTIVSAPAAAPTAPPADPGTAANVPTTEIAAPTPASVPAAPAEETPVATPVASATAARRAVITPANAAPWVDQYVRAALAGLDLRSLRIAVGWQLPPMSPAPTMTVAIDRNGYVRSADLDRNVGFPALRAIMQHHFDRHRRTVPFPEMLARDLDEVVVPVTLASAPGT